MTRVLRTRVRGLAMNNAATHQSASLGVLIPTRNSATLMPDHIAALNRWVEVADEVVVMDSFSTDGTVEMLQERLRHRNIRFCSHPPGLYASWNAGLQELTADYAYISTVGDTITGEGIQTLLSAATSLQADVVISKPVFRRPGGEEVAMEWPVDDIIRSLRVTAPRRLHPLEVITFAAVHAAQALSGSCASNVFRTQVLQRFAFPTEFGTAGDGIWSLQHAADVTWGVVPEKCSTFLMHPTTLSQAENRLKPGAARVDTVLRTAVDAWRRTGVVTEADLAVIEWDEMERALTGYLDAKTGFDRFRKARWPWILHPLAWQTRLRRDQMRKRLAALKGQALRRFEGLPGTPAEA